MTERSRRTTRLVAGLAISAAVTAAISGCGVKNLPVAPQTGKTPSVVAEQQQSGDTNFLGSSGGDGVKVDRISSVQTDNVVSAAAVTRNTGTRARPFFLDGLLN